MRTVTRDLLRAARRHGAVVGGGEVGGRPFQDGGVVEVNAEAGLDDRVRGEDEQELDIISPDEVGDVDEGLVRVGDLGEGCGPSPKSSKGPVRATVL